MLVKAPNNIVDVYPYSLRMLKADHPNTPFPAQPSEELLAEFDVYVVEQRAEPDGDVVRDANPVLVNGKFQQAFEIRNFTTEELKANTQAEVVRLAKLINRECERRIYGVVSDNAQKNIMAHRVEGLLTEAQVQTWRDGLIWIRAMQDTARILIESGEENYVIDTHWPSHTPEIKALADLF
ncbi:MAG: hypothetical protein ACRBB6_03120 [Neptuniibacter sp.]